MRRLALAMVITTLGISAVPARAQDPVVHPDTMPVADTIPDEPPSPRAAFVRGLLVPGWGHMYVGSYGRAAVYFSLQSTSWFMLVRTLNRLGDVKERDRRLTGLAGDSLALAMAADTALARMLEDPLAYETALLTYPGLQGTRSLVNARRQQRQDWITYTLFFTFAAAVDAYVTAHLKEFPADITASPSEGGGVRLELHVPVGRWR